MSEISRFFNEEYMNYILTGIHTAAPAKVIKYDANTKRADLQPLFLTADKEGNIYKQSPINGAIVPKHCQPDIKDGCLVFYMAFQRSAANLNGTDFIDPDSHVFFSDNDSIVVGVWDG
jgi:hypothetical protein